MRFALQTTPAPGESASRFCRRVQSTNSLGGNMKIGIMGTGGVGVYYGGLLVQAGQDVIFIARGAHLQAIREKGLRVKSVHGDFLVSKVQATDKTLEVGPIDLVIVATKTYHTDEAAQAIRPM